MPHRLQAPSRSRTIARRLQRGIGWLVVASGGLASIAMMMQLRIGA